MKKKDLRRKQRVERGAGTGKRILIVTEGECTEPNYLKGLRARMGLKSVDVEVIHPPYTDPLGLLEAAKKLKSNAERQARNGEGVRFDEVWVVYDHERIHAARRCTLNDVRQKAASAKIKIAASDPCFEIWLLLHFCYTTRLCNGYAEVKPLLREHWPAYEKADAVGAVLFERLQDAVEQADKLRKHHEESGGAGNPGTDVDHLVWVMDGIVPEERRLLKNAKSCLNPVPPDHIT